MLFCSTDHLIYGWSLLSQLYSHTTKALIFISTFPSSKLLQNPDQTFWSATHSPGNCLLLGEKGLTQLLSEEVVL